VDIKKHTIAKDAPLKLALEMLNQLGENLTLFVLNDHESVIGVITDGDVRRYLVKDSNINSAVENCMQKNFKSLRSNYSLSDIDALKKTSAKVVPIVDENFKILRIINLGKTRSLLPINAVIMAGGRGERLKPLTDAIPKPLLKVGDKAIIDHCVDRLANYGVKNYFITVRYLGEKIIDHLGDGSSKEISIKYINESEPLGTIGAVSQINEFDADNVIVMNSDLLTTIDFEDFYRHFEENGSDMSVASISYKVDVPYAVFETKNNEVKSFQEKPTFNYYSNAGIYLIKRSLLKMIPENTHFNATDFMTKLMENGYKVTHYPILGYWLDIGKHDDYKKAQEDIKFIKF
jgi:dTDP-glucose pyrophosphorylase